MTLNIKLCWVFLQLLKRLSVSLRLDFFLLLGLPSGESSPSKALRLSSCIFCSCCMAPSVKTITLLVPVLGCSSCNVPFFMALFRSESLICMNSLALMPRYLRRVIAILFRAQTCSDIFLGFFSFIRKS
uniref:Putative integrase/recombinase protein n=1 Tax=Gonatozygon brebissonii TaxID=184482 RepID=A0A6G9IG47_9VIRI|nr:putative integrase/recombinase protein [Gonatozygon brebissonii]QIQ23041.1 putative integrase/recombinase protein [Gonatozygon brebissonii]